MLSNKENKRNLSLDILRILSMLMVVFFHYCVHGNGEQIFSASFSSQQAVSYLLGSWGLVGVTCFFMISSWFMLDRDSFSVRKWVVLYVEVVTVHVLCLLITKGLGGAVTARQLMLAVVSPINGTYWYVTAYMLLMLLTPALNVLIRQCNDKNLIFLTELGFFTTCILFPVLRFFGGGTGTSTLFLAVTMYLLTACIKREIVRLKVNGIMMLVSFALAAIFLGGLSYVATRIGILQISKHIYDLVDIYSPIPVVLGVMVFVYFKDVVKVSEVPKLFGGGGYCSSLQGIHLPYICCMRTLISVI